MKVIKLIKVGDIIGIDQRGADFGECRIYVVGKDAQGNIVDGGGSATFSVSPHEFHDRWQTGLTIAMGNNINSATYTGLAERLRCDTIGTGVDHLEVTIHRL